MAFKWTEYGIELLRRRTLDGAACAAIVADLGCIERTACRMQIDLGLVAAQARRPWSAAEREIVSRDFPHLSTAKIARQLDRTVSQVYQCAAKMGLAKTEEYLASPDACRLRRDATPASIACRYPKGHVPANAGLRRPGWSPGRMAETQFKKGARTGKAAENWRPLGTVVVDTEGFLRIKVREGMKGEPYGFGNTKIWPLLNRHVWEQHHGPIPPSHAVVFRDRDRSNCAIENLELISRADLMRRNTIHNLPPELKDTIMLLGAVKRKVREQREEHDDRLAQPSV